MNSCKSLTIAQYPSQGEFGGWLKFTIHLLVSVGLGALNFSATAADCPSNITSLISSCTLPAAGSVSVETGGSVIGQNGNNGVNGSSGGSPTSGSTGFSGSNAVSVPYSAILFSVSSDVSPAVKGGDGGGGGNGGTTSVNYVSGARGGAGGSGFNGIYVTGALNTLNIASSISGGAGGRGGSGGDATGSPGRGGNGGAGGNGGHGVYNIGAITTLNNTGSIRGGSGGAGGAGGAGSSLRGTAGASGSSGNSINNATTITELNNLQGASSTALNYRGNLPTNYNIIVSSTANYGKLSGVTVSGTTNFGISSLSTTSSSILNTSLTSVLTGLGASSVNVVGGTNTTVNNVPSWRASSNGYSYTLSMTGVGTNTWNLIITACSVCDGGTTPTPTPTPTPASVDTASTTTVTSASSTVSSGNSASLNSFGTASSPVLAGGALLLAKGERSSQAISVQTEGGTLVAPSTGAAQLSGVLSGVGKLTFSGTGTTVVSGANTYSGGTTVSEGTLALLGGTLGSGEVYVAQGAQLVGTGSIAGPVTVAGLFKPGNSPGYIASSSNITMIPGSIYQQDIAGTTQASELSPVGATGYYSYLNITGGQFIINAGATLTPALSNLFNSLESGYGSTPYTPVLGDRFRIVTADGGIAGKFSTVTQPLELGAGTQFLPFYNMLGSNSIDLAVIPVSYKNTIAATSGNKNAQSIGNALDAMVVSSQVGSSSALQDQLLYATSVNTAASLAAYAQGLAGEVYSAAVAVIAQTTQHVQQAVLTRLGDTIGIGLSNSMTSPAGNTALMASGNALLSGGVVPSAISSNPNVDFNAEYKSLSNGNVWGALAYQKGNRSSDSNSGGWNSNLYQLVFGSDLYVADNTRVGGGIALSSTSLNPTDGSGKIQQGSVFAYGKMPVEAYVVDVMASFGLNTSDLSRGDVTGLTYDFRNKSIAGNDTMVSLGVSRPIDMDNFRITPYARVTWQMVTQSGVKEGSSASALSVDSFTGHGVRGVLGIAAGSRSNDPMTEKYTYRVYVGAGADSSGVLNPLLNASLAGVGTQIMTPQPGATFVQAGLYGTAKLADNAYAFAGLSGEARSGQTLGTVNVGLRVQF